MTGWSNGCKLVVERGAYCDQDKRYLIWCKVNRNWKFVPSSSLYAILWSGKLVGCINYAVWIRGFGWVWKFLWINTKINSFRNFEFFVLARKQNYFSNWTKEAYHWNLKLFAQLAHTELRAACYDLHAQLQVLFCGVQSEADVIKISLDISTEGALLGARFFVKLL